jgi:hypothetical protein
MENRFIVRPDPMGFSVYDLSTGETVVIAMSRQSGLSREDAEHTAAMFNQNSEPMGPTAH